MSDMSANVEPKGGRIDNCRDNLQVPAHVESIIGSKYAPIKHLKRRFQQRWAGTLQQHGPLLWKVRDQLSLPVDKGKLNRRCRHRTPHRFTEQPHHANPTHVSQEVPPGRLRRWKIGWLHTLCS